MSVAGVVKVLGGERTLGVRIRSEADLDEAVRAGLPKRTLEVLSAEIEPEPTRRRSVVVHRVVPRATWARIRDRLSPEQSEVVARFGRLWAEALRIWEDEANARRFLMTPHPMLNGRAPIDAMRTEIGGRQVERILINVEHGLPV